MTVAALSLPPSAGRIKRILHFPLTRILLGILVTVLPVALTFAIVQGVVEKSMRIVWPYLLAATLCILAYSIYIRLLEKRKVIELSLPGAAKELGNGLLLGAALLSVTMGTLALLGVYKVSGSNPWTVILIPLAEQVMVGFFEEILFRGVIFRISEQSLGSWIALFLSGLVFALAHLPNAGVTPLAIGVTFAAGILLTVAYMLTRRLWLAIGLHIGWNYFLGDIFSIAVSGHESKGLLQATLTGPEWLTGGQYGVEASVVSLVFISALSVYLLRAAQRRGNFMLPYWKKHGIA